MQNKDKFSEILTSYVVSLTHSYCIGSYLMNMIFTKLFKCKQIKNVQKYAENSNVTRGSGIFIP